MDGFKLTITKEFHFHAAHYLALPDENSCETSKQIYGACSRMHGHTYRLKVTVTRPLKLVLESKDKMLMNFSKLKEIVNKLVISKVDHSLLNEVDIFKNKIATAEEMIVVIWQVLEPALREYNVHLDTLELYETDTSYATLRRAI